MDDAVPASRSARWQRYGTDSIRTGSPGALHEKDDIGAFLRREALRGAADVRYRPDSVKIGYEISFTR